MLDEVLEYAVAHCVDLRGQTVNHQPVSSLPADQMRHSIVVSPIFDARGQSTRLQHLQRVQEKLLLKRSALLHIEEHGRAGLISDERRRGGKAKKKKQSGP
jgi:hypothetical protein